MVTIWLIRLASINLGYTTTQYCNTRSIPFCFLLSSSSHSPSPWPLPPTAADRKPGSGVRRLTRNQGRYTILTRFCTTLIPPITQLGLVAVHTNPGHTHHINLPSLFRGSTSSTRTYLPLSSKSFNPTTQQSYNTSISRSLQLFLHFRSTTSEKRRTSNSGATHYLT